MMTKVEYGVTKLKIERENEEKLRRYPILQKQLEIALATLRCYGNPDNWDKNIFFPNWTIAQENLNKIEELNK